MAIVFNNLSASGGGSKQYLHHIYIEILSNAGFFNIITDDETPITTTALFIEKLKKYGRMNIHFPCSVNNIKNKIFNYIYVSSNMVFLEGYVLNSTTLTLNDVNQTVFTSISTGITQMVTDAYIKRDTVTEL